MSGSPLRIDLTLDDKPPPPFIDLACDGDVISILDSSDSSGDEGEDESNTQQQMQQQKQQQHTAGTAITRTHTASTSAHTQQPIKLTNNPAGTDTTHTKGIASKQNAPTTGNKVAPPSSSAHPLPTTANTNQQLAAGAAAATAPTSATRAAPPAPTHSHHQQPPPLQRPVWVSTPYTQPTPPHRTPAATHTPPCTHTQQTARRPPPRNNPSTSQPHAHNPAANQPSRHANHPTITRPCTSTEHTSSPHIPIAKSKPHVIPTASTTPAPPVTSTSYAPPTASTTSAPTVTLLSHAPPAASMSPAQPVPSTHHTKHQAPTRPARPALSRQHHTPQSVQMQASPPVPPPFVSPSIRHPTVPPRSPHTPATSQPAELHTSTPSPHTTPSTTAPRPLNSASPTPAVAQPANPHTSTPATSIPPSTQRPIRPSPSLPPPSQPAAIRNGNCPAPPRSTPPSHDRSHPAASRTPTAPNQVLLQQTPATSTPPLHQQQQHTPQEQCHASPNATQLPPPPKALAPVPPPQQRKHRPQQLHTATTLKKKRQQLLLPKQPHVQLSPQQQPPRTDVQENGPPLPSEPPAKRQRLDDYTPSPTQKAPSTHAVVAAAAAAERQGATAPLVVNSGPTAAAAEAVVAAAAGRQGAAAALVVSSGPKAAAADAVVAAAAADGEGARSVAEKCQAAAGSPKAGGASVRADDAAPPQKAEGVSVRADDAAPPQKAAGAAVVPGQPAPSLNTGGAVVFSGQATPSPTPESGGAIPSRPGAAPTAAAKAAEPSLAAEAAPKAATSTARPTHSAAAAAQQQSPQQQQQPRRKRPQQEQPPPTPTTAHSTQQPPTPTTAQSTQPSPTPMTAHSTQPPTHQNNHRGSPPPPPPRSPPTSPKYRKKLRSLPHRDPQAPRPTKKQRLALRFPPSRPLLTKRQVDDGWKDVAKPREWPQPVYFTNKQFDVQEWEGNKPAASGRQSIRSVVRAWRESSGGWKHPEMDPQQPAQFNFPGEEDEQWGQVDQQVRGAEGGRSGHQARVGGESQPRGVEVSKGGSSGAVAQALGAGTAGLPSCSLEGSYTGGAAESDTAQQSVPEREARGVAPMAPAVGGQLGGGTWALRPPLQLPCGLGPEALGHQPQPEAGGAVGAGGADVARCDVDWSKPKAATGLFRGDVLGSPRMRQACPMLACLMRNKAELDILGVTAEEVVARTQFLYEEATRGKFTYTWSSRPLHLVTKKLPSDLVLWYSPGYLHGYPCEQAVQASPVLHLRVHCNLMVEGVRSQKFACLPLRSAGRFYSEGGQRVLDLVTEIPVVGKERVQEPESVWEDRRMWAGVGRRGGIYGSQGSGSWQEDGGGAYCNGGGRYGEGPHAVQSSKGNSRPGPGGAEWMEVKIAGVPEKAFQRSLYGEAGWASFQEAVWQLAPGVRVGGWAEEAQQVASCGGGGGRMSELRPGDRREGLHNMVPRPVDGVAKGGADIPWDEAGEKLQLFGCGHVMRDARNAGGGRDVAGTPEDRFYHAIHKAFESGAFLSHINGQPLLQKVLLHCYNGIPPRLGWRDLDDVLQRMGL